MVSIEAIVSGAIAGLLSNFIARFLWRVIRQPDLHFEGMRQSRPIDEEEKSWTTYQVQVSNTGGQAARNSKPELDFVGELKATHIGRDNTTEQHGISISTTLCWSEGENPARINISPDETAAFELLRIQEEDGTVQFPSEDGWQRHPSFTLRYEASIPDRETPFERKGELTIPIDTSDFRRTQWQTQIVKVTAENISSGITSPIAMAWDESPLPSVTLAGRR